MAKTLKDYPEAINRINEAILSNYGRRVDTFEKFQTAFNSYMRGEKYTTEDVKETYSNYTDINRFAEKLQHQKKKTFDSELQAIKSAEHSLSVKEMNKNFNTVGYIHHRQVRAREWKTTSETTGKTYTVLRDTKGRILSKNRK